jgi:hypothetical protein
MLTAIESSLPTAPLQYRIAKTGSIHLVDDPGAWCAAHLARDTPAVICNGDENDYVGLMAVAMEAMSVPQGRPLVQVMVRFPWTPPFIKRLPDMFCTFGPGARAYWGTASSSETDFAIVKGAGRKSSDPGFPRPISPSVLIPGRLAWISYWSDATCRWLGFSPVDPRATLFARVIPIQGHGVVLQLTEDLLDLDRPEHLAALTAAYAAFPAIDNKWGL